MIVVLTLRWLPTSTIKTTLTSKNELFLVRINRVYDAVLDTGSIYTILHSPNVNTTLPSTTIQYGSQTSTVYFDTRDVHIGSQSFQYLVGMALPRPSHYNILGLARGSPWIPCHVHFSQRWVAFGPSPAPMDGTFTEADRSVLELQKTFMNMLHIDTHTEFGVPRAHMPAYAAACGIQSALMYFTTAAV